MEDRTSTSIARDRSSNTTNFFALLQPQLLGTGLPKQLFCFYIARAGTGLPKQLFCFYIARAGTGLPKQLFCFYIAGTGLPTELLCSSSTSTARDRPSNTTLLVYSNVARDRSSNTTPLLYFSVNCSGPAFQHNRFAFILLGPAFQHNCFAFLLGPERRERDDFPTAYIVVYDNTYTYRAERVKRDGCPTPHCYPTERCAGSETVVRDSHLHRVVSGT